MADTSTSSGSFWRRKIAGIPMIYLAGGIVAILAIVAFRMRNTNSDSDTVDQPMETDQNSDSDAASDYDTAFDQSVADYSGFTAKGSVTAAPADNTGATSEPVVETNETWLAKAVQWNITKGVSAGAAQSALQAYLNGSNLTHDQGTIRDNTVKEFGLPPDPPSSTNATPNPPTAATPSPIARRQGPLARNHKVMNTSENTYAKLAALYYPTADATSIALIRRANVGKLVGDGPFAIGTLVRIPQYVAPKYYTSTKKTDTLKEIAAKNGISQDGVRALNPGMKFPVKSGTRVRVK